MPRTGRKILYLTPQVPYPPEQGTALRNYHLLAGMASQHRVSLLSFGLPGRAPDARLAALCQALVVTDAPTRHTHDRLQTLLTTTAPDMAHRLRSTAYGEALLQMLSDTRYDVLQIEGIELASYGFLVRRWLGKDAPKIVFDDHNAEAELQRRAALADLRSPQRWPAGVYSLIQWRRLTRFERRACEMADAVLAVSAADADILQRQSRHSKVYVVPNGVDTRTYRPGLEDSLPLEHPAVVFTGKMDYRPNVDAVLWFHASVWPRIRQRVEGARFYVVGKAPHARLAPLAQDPSVTVTGYVPDVLPYFGGADVYVAPLLVGGGTRLKLLQALAAGLPLVTTTLGAEGIHLIDQEHALFADTPTEFAAAVTCLLADREKARDLGQTGREFVIQEHDWQRIIPRLERVYASL